MPAGTIEVCGPHKISMNGSEVGRGDNDDLFRLETEYQYTDLYTNEFGTMPAEAVLVGARAIVSFSLVYFDRSAFMQAVDKGSTGTGTAQWVFPTVGRKTGAGDTTDNTFSIVLTPDGAGGGGKTVTVYRCRLLSVAYADFGNKANRAIIRCEGLPDVDNAQTASAIYNIA